MKDLRELYRRMVFNIVADTLKGRIECRSMPGLGTSFTVTIPMRIPQ